MPSRMEYYNINMEKAIEFVVSKSKSIKTKIDEEEITTDFLNMHIIRNKAFNIKYNSFL